MTTSEYIVTQILHCGILDIETMFKTITDNDLFYDAFHDLKDNGFNNIDANSIWYRAMELGIYKVFGSDLIDKFEIDANCMASSVNYLGDVDMIEDFEKKVAKFEELTGFPLSY